MGLDSERMDLKPFYKFRHFFKMILIVIFGISVVFVSRNLSDRTSGFSKDELLKLELSKISKALYEFKSVCGRFPFSAEGLQFLNKEITPGLCKNFPQKGFLGQQAFFLDPWENDYIYESDGKSFRLGDLDKKVLIESNAK